MHKLLFNSLDFFMQSKDIRVTIQTHFEQSKTSIFFSFSVLIKYEGEHACRITV